MNRRQMRRMATIKLASAARSYSARITSEADLADGDVDALTPDDRQRLARAFDELGLELEIRAGITRRAPAARPEIPGQTALFTTEEQP